MRTETEKTTLPTIDLERLIKSKPKIQKAFDFATTAHSGLTRAEGTPYISHCVEVARIIYEEWEITVDENLIIAAFLHDTVEDTGVTLEQIEREFGLDVATLVDGVSKFRSERGEGSDKETLRKVVTTAYLDPRVLLLKLADRLHNMRTIQFVPPEKQKPKSKETLIYAKMAESLGLWRVKLELEDLSYQYVHPEEYARVKSEVDTDPRLHSLFLAYWVSTLEGILAANGLTGFVESAQNGYLTLNDKRRKLATRGQAQPHSFRDINDLVALKIVLPTTDDCYRCLGIIHREQGEVVNFNRFDEFIGANARINGYQAIQTTIELPHGAVEIDIMTTEMADFNNWGVVSSIRNGVKDLRQFARKLIFTPSGEVVFLPENATAIDFAYAINASLGANATQAIIDGRTETLSNVIPNGSTVEIAVSESPRLAPDPQLVYFCLPQTRTAIQKQLLLKDREDMINQGTAIAESLMVDLKLPNLEDIEDLTLAMLYRLGCQSLTELFFKLGSGMISQDLLSQELNIAGITKEKLGLTTIRVAGEDRPGILVYLTGLVTNHGGNIFTLGLRRIGKHYWLRFVVQGIGASDENSIRNTLESDPRFDNWSIV